VFDESATSANFLRGIHLLFLTGCIMFQSEVISAQPANPGGATTGAALQSPQDSVKTLYQQHLEILSKAAQPAGARLGSLKLLAAMVKAGNVSEKEQIQSIFEQLMTLMQTPDTAKDPELVAAYRKLREEALKQLPLLTAKRLEEDNEAYEKMVDALIAYSSEIPNEYQKSWLVTQTLSEVLMALPIVLEDGVTNNGNPTVKRRTIKQASRGLKEIAVDSKQDLQVRYNAVNGIITKGNGFLDDPAGDGKPHTFKSNADVTSYYILVDSLNEIATSDNLPPLLLRQCSAALEKYLNVKLP